MGSHQIKVNSNYEHQIKVIIYLWCLLAKALGKPFSQLKSNGYTHAPRSLQTIRVNLSELHTSGKNGTSVVLTKI